MSKSEALEALETAIQILSDEADMDDPNDEVSLAIDGLGELKASITESWK